MKVDHEKSIMLHKSPAESPCGHADGNFRSRTVLGRLSRRLIYDQNIRLAHKGAGDQILLQKGSL
jgi:hypothetical protein